MGSQRGRSGATLPAPWAPGSGGAPPAGEQTHAEEDAGGGEGPARGRRGGVESFLGQVGAGGLFVPEGFWAPFRSST